MNWRDWVASRWLVEHKTSEREIADLLGVADRDLSDCQTPGLSADRRLATAYNAALQLAIVALAAAGFRPAREAHHYWAIQSLAHTLGADRATVDALDALRKKRNLSDYQRAGAVSDREAEEAIALARKLRAEVLAWLRANHPHLVSR